MRSGFAGNGAYPFVVGSLVGAATVAAAWGWVNFLDFFGNSWHDTVLEADLPGLWNALVLGLGFGRLFVGGSGKEDAGATG